MCEDLFSNDCEAVAIYYQSGFMSSKNSCIFSYVTDRTKGLERTIR